MKQISCKHPPLETGLDGVSDNEPKEFETRPGEYFGSILNKAIKRRAFLKGMGAAGATGAALVVTPTLMVPRVAAADDPGSRLTFETVPPGNEPDIVVPPGYNFNVIIRWGDPLVPGAPAFDVNNQTRMTQSQQFGFNCDLVLWFPLISVIQREVERANGELSERGQLILGSVLPRFFNLPSREAALVAVNHEFTSGGDMFPGYDPENPTRDQCEAEIEAHGVSIIEVALGVGRDRQWEFVQNSPFNRRITGTTPIDITGPLRGNDFMKTSADPSGTEVLGCFNNCAGGKTPWGTVLTCEENFDQYFANNDMLPDDNPSKALSQRIAPESGATDRKWERFDSRFDVSIEPNEYNRFGYVIEIDPYDPAFKPKKRTALGRFKHEGATVAITKDERVVIYSGDDARFEYVYKFVTEGRFQPRDRNRNLNLLDNGTLFVARFDVGVVEGDEMGTGEWLPLVWEPGNALDQAGFANQEEVLLNTRGAADVLGATPMDRPEDIQPSPKTGRVYVTLTNNSRRTEDSELKEAQGRTVDAGEDEANPRGPNPHGHIVEIIEDGDDAAATTFRWHIFIKCGDPAIPAHEAEFGDVVDPVAAGVSPISDPDNIIFDDDGNLWIATDGQFFSDDVGFGQNDGVFAVPVEGENRGLLRQFLSSVPGAEVCGPEFSGDNRTFFCAIQHPHDGNAFTSFWPVDETVVSKPSLIAVRHERGLKIGQASFR